MEKIQHADATDVDVENLRPGMLSETETSDPSVVSKRRRLDLSQAGRIAVAHGVNHIALVQHGDFNPITLSWSDDKVAVNAGPSSRSFSSKYRGVSWHNQTGKWKAQIKVKCLHSLCGNFHLSLLHTAGGICRSWGKM